MPDPEGTAPQYTVQASGALLKVVRALQRAATRQGRGEEMLAALRTVY